MRHVFAFMAIALLACDDGRPVMVEYYACKSTPEMRAWMAECLSGKRWEGECKRVMGEMFDCPTKTVCTRNCARKAGAE